MKIIKGLWWLSLVTGVLLLSFGLVAIVRPELLLAFVTILVGVGFLFAGSKDLVTGLSLKNTKKEWWKHLVYAATNIALGLLLVLDPQMSLVVVLYYLAFWAIVRGISQITFGFITPILSGLSTSSGIVLVILGTLVLFYPEQISEVLMTVIGVIATIIGIYQIISASNKRVVVESSTKTKIKDAVVIEDKNNN